VWAYGRRQTHKHTHTHTHTQTTVATIHFASSTTHAKCNYCFAHWWGWNLAWRSGPYSSTPNFTPLYLLVGWSAAGVSLYCQLQLQHGWTVWVVSVFWAWTLVAVWFLCGLCSYWHGLYRMLRICCRHYWSDASRHLWDAAVKLQTFAPYKSTGRIYIVDSYILVDKDIGIPYSTVKPFMQVCASSIVLRMSWLFPPVESTQEPRYTKESPTSTWLFRMVTVKGTLLVSLEAWILILIQLI